MLKRTLFAGIFAAASICAVSAAEVFKAGSMADFQKGYNVSLKGNVFTGKKGFSIIGKKTFKIDPAKKYRISATVKGISGKFGTVYLGFKPMDAKGKQIQSRFVRNTPKSFTELAAAAKKGDKVIKVKDASKWQDNTTYSNVAFNAKADFSDLPNSELVYTAKKAIVKKGNVWEITLSKPLTKDYPAGTKIRQQMNASTFIYAKIFNGLTNKEHKINATVSGLYKDQIGEKKFWPGTKSAAVILMHLGAGKDAVIEFKDFKVEEL